MRGAAGVVVALLVALSVAPASEAHDGCVGERSGQIRIRLERVVAHSEGAASFMLNDRFACAEIDFRWNGVFTADDRVDMPDSTASVHQVQVIDDVTVHAWFNVTIPDSDVFGTNGFGMQPWFPGTPIDIAWNVTGAGAIEFSYHGYE